MELLLRNSLKEHKLEAIISKVSSSSHDFNCLACITYWKKRFHIILRINPNIELRYRTVFSANLLNVVVIFHGNRWFDPNFRTSPNTNKTVNKPKCIDYRRGLFLCIFFFCFLCGSFCTSNQRL